MTPIITKEKETVDEQIAKMVPEQFKHDKAFTNYYRAIHTVYSMKNYSNYLKRYMAYRRITECKILLKEKPRFIEDKIGDFLAIECKGIKNSSKKPILAALKKFYVHNNVILNWTKICSQIGRKERSDNRPYHLDEITRMLQHTDYRERMIVLLLASTGMRIGALPELRIGDLKVVPYDQEKMYAITAYRGEREQYVTYCTPECAKSIDNYIDFRKRIGEPFEESSPLIRNAVDVVTAKNNPDNRFAKRINLGGLRGIMDKILIGSGVREQLKKSGGTTNKMRYESHMSRGFRKFYYQGLVGANLHPIHRSALAGHMDGSGTIEATNLAMIYGKPEQTDLFTSYITAIPFLTIDKSQTIAKQNEELKDQLSEAKVSRKEFDDMKQDMEKKLEQKQKDLMEEMYLRENNVKTSSMPWEKFIPYVKYKMTRMTPEELEKYNEIHSDEAYSEFLDREEAEEREAQIRRETGEFFIFNRGNKRNAKRE